MNPYYRKKVLPDSQPAFFPEAVEDTFCETEDGDEELDSQILISAKNRQSNQVLPAKTTFFTDECDLLDSQPLFTEAENNLDIAKDRIDTTRKRQINNNILNKAVEDTFYDTEDDDKESKYSQSLISPKNRQSNRGLPAKTTFLTDEHDLSDSQPLFTEAEKDLDTAKERIDMTRKRQIDNNVLNNEESQSLIASSKTRRSNESNSSALTEHSNSNGCETKVLEAKSMKFPNDQETKTDTESDMDSKNGGSVPSDNCVDCIFDKELDKRNYYFGNLLIGELQFLPPCMRSEAYVTILKYVDSLKQQHRKRHTN